MARAIPQAPGPRRVGFVTRAPNPFVSVRTDPSQGFVGSSNETWKSDWRQLPEPPALLDDAWPLVLPTTEATALVALPDAELPPVEPVAETPGVHAPT